MGGYKPLDKETNEANKFSNEGGDVSVRTAEPILTRLIDTQTTYTYIGRAPVGSNTTDAVWRIQRIENSTGSGLWSGKDFDVKWSERETISYS